MRPGQWGSIVLLACAGGSQASDGIWLREQTSRRSDTLEMRLSSPRGRPLRYRVEERCDSTKACWMRIDLQYGGNDSLRFLSDSKENRLEYLGDGISRVWIPVTKQAPWKTTLVGPELILSWLSPQPSRPLWKNPWVIAGVGGTIGGAIALWVLQSRSRSTSQPSSADSDVPPLDVTLPH